MDAIAAAEQVQAARQAAQGQAINADTDGRSQMVPQGEALQATDVEAGRAADGGGRVRGAIGCYVGMFPAGLSAGGQERKSDQEARVCSQDGLQLLRGCQEAGHANFVGVVTGTDVAAPAPDDAHGQSVERKGVFVCEVSPREGAACVTCRLVGEGDEAGREYEALERGLGGIGAGRLAGLAQDAGSAGGDQGKLALSER